MTQDQTDAHLDLISRGGGPLLAVRIRSIREQALQKHIRAARGEVKEVLDERVLVLVRHASHVVHDVTRVVPYEELRAAALEVRVGGERGEALYEAAVCGSWVGVRRGARIIECGEDAWGTAFFDEIAHDLA